jgi:hypothetical protein
MGAFSFINGKQIEALVKNIAQGAVGMVVHMVIKSLCPMCQAVIEAMQALSTFAAKASIDSCRVSSNLAHMLVDKLTPTSAQGTDGLKGACSTKASTSGEVTDFASANDAVCATLNSAMGSLTKKWEETEKALYGDAPASKKPLASAVERCSLGVGNCTWLVLTQLFPSVDGNPGIDDPSIPQRILLMNLIGVTLTAEGARCGTNAVTIPTQAGTAAEPIISVTCMPTLGIKEALGLFMCGVPSTAPSAKEKYRWQTYCANLFATASNNGGSDKEVSDLIENYPIMDCDLTSAEALAGQNKPYYLCSTLKASTVLNSKLISGGGFLFEVESLLTEAVKRVRNNVPYSGDAEGRRIMQLIAMAPYPLYQAINAAAVYPEAGQQLVDSLTELVAEHIAYAYMTQILSLRASAAFKNITVPLPLIERIAIAMNTLKMEGDKDKSRFGKTLASQQMVMEEIRKINVVIQTSVMSEQMLNMQKFANTVNSSATNPSVGGN